MNLSFRLIESEQREWKFNLNNGNIFPRNICHNFFIKFTFMCFCKFLFFKRWMIKIFRLFIYCNLKFIWQKYKCSFLPYRKHCPKHNTRPLILFMEIIFVYSECHKKPLSRGIFYEQISWFTNIKSGDIPSNHSTSQVLLLF